MRNALALLLVSALGCASAVRRNPAPAVDDADAPAEPDAATSTPPVDTKLIAPDVAEPGLAPDEALAPDTPAEDQVSDDLPSGAGDVTSPADIKSNSTGQAGNACPGYKKGTHTQGGVAAADFCAAYAKSCGYKAGGTAFADAADCEMTYAAGSDAVRTCRAGHLCEAVVSTTANGKSTNCLAAAHGTVCH